jgi:hypothetical protein
MRHSITVRLLFIFALLFAQTGGLVHGISHTLSDIQPHKSLAHEKLCDLCATYAQVGSALGSHPLVFTPSVQLERLSDSTCITQVTTTLFSAFSARAPPYSV